jgi:hypothetical protein
MKERDDVCASQACCLLQCYLPVLSYRVLQTSRIHLCLSPGLVSFSLTLDRLQLRCGHNATCLSKRLSDSNQSGVAHLFAIVLHSTTIPN